MQVQVFSGDGRAWPLITQQSGGSEVETWVGMKMKTAGSETSVELGKLGQMESEKVRRAAAGEHLQRDASTGVPETQGRWLTVREKWTIFFVASWKSF